jgi:hypothetical protein
MNHTHLTDEQLTAMCVAGPVSDAGQHGVDGVVCALCERRRATLARFLNEVSASATVASDGAFSLGRLARQRAKILQRVDQQRLEQERLELQPCAGRVIAFPLAHAQRTSQLHTRPVRRWIAGAAAAGLLIGMVAGHLAHEFPVPGLGRPSAVPEPVSRQASVPLRAVTVTLTDDDFLREIEAAVGSSGPVALRRIDAVTPVAWAVR